MATVVVCYAAADRLIGEALEGAIRTLGFEILAVDVFLAGAEDPGAEPAVVALCSPRSLAASSVRDAASLGLASGKLLS
jgi:hypothetical protein